MLLFVVCCCGLSFVMACCFLFIVSCLLFVVRCFGCCFLFFCCFVVCWLFVVGHMSLLVVSRRSCVVCWFFFLMCSARCVLVVVYCPFVVRCLLFVVSC